MRKGRDYLYYLNGPYKISAKNKLSWGCGEGKRIEQPLGRTILGESNLLTHLIFLILQVRRKEAMKLRKQKIQKLFNIRGITCSHKNQVLEILNNLYRLSKEQLTAL